MRIQVWMARWYPRTKIPQSKLFCWVGRVGVWGSGGGRGFCGRVRSMQMGGASGGGVVGVGRGRVGVRGWAVVGVT